MCAAVNLFKYSMSEQEYIWWATKVADNNRSEAQAFHGYAKSLEEGEKENGHG